MERVFQLPLSTVLLILSAIFWSSCFDIKQLFTPENEELVKIIEEEMDKFRVNMTRSFMEAHSRRKRGVVSDIEIEKDGNFLETLIHPVGPFSTFSFDSVPYVIQRDGIFRLDGLSNLQTETHVADILTRVGFWTLPENEIVLDGIEWKRTFFILTTTQTFSTIYTIHANSQDPVFRQRIHNRGNAVAAQFFEFRRNLYLVMCNDNEQHSTTFSPVFLWAESYMDEIHQIQTTGASAVKAFTIDSKKYIAIAQKQDSTGNMLLGTLILSMNHMESLERVQLLWSHGANSLHFMSTAKEHFLVIGQEKESSLVYWFGGMDFIYWQTLDGLQGRELVMDGLQISEDEPILIASDGNALQFFSRSASATKIMTTWVQSKSLAIISANSDVKITQTKFLILSSREVYFAVTRKSPNADLESLRVYPVNFVERKLAVSRIKDPGDKLSQCLQTLSTTLQEAEPILNKIRTEEPNILTTNGDWDFPGILASEKVIKLDPAQSKVHTAQITPELHRAGSSERFKTAPSQLLSNIQDTTDKLQLMKSQVKNVVFKSKPNQVTGNFAFPNFVSFSNVQGPGADLQVSEINSVQWNDIQSFALRFKSSKQQQTTAPWTVDQLVAHNVAISEKSSELWPNNFLKKSCERSQSQSSTGVHTFHKDLKVLNGINLSSVASINGIKFSKIVLKQNAHQEIRGYKHTPFIEGNYITERVNDVRLPSWFATVAKVNSPVKQVFTGPVIVEENAVLHIDKVSVEQLNAQSWHQFTSLVLTDGMDQTIRGFITCKDLRVDHLSTALISGVRSEDLLVSDSNQRVDSLISVENLRVNGHMSTQGVNGIRLEDAVNRLDNHVLIGGPVVLEDFQVQNVFLADGITIAEKDVSILANLRKMHIYSTTDDNPLLLKGKVSTNGLISTSINEAAIADFATNCWSKNENNVATPAELVLSDRLVSTLNDNFESQTVNGFRFPTDFVSLDQSGVILHTGLDFKRAVHVLGNVTMEDGKTIEKIDMSEIQSMIVDDNFHGLVRGTKTFAFPIVATHGASFGLLNSMNLVEDVVMLSSEMPQRVDGTVTFKDQVETTSVRMHNGDVEVVGLVNGLNLEEVKSTTAYKDEDNLIEGEVKFARGIKARMVSVDTLNNLNVRDITDNMIFLHRSESQSFEGGITVQNGGSRLFKNSIARLINGVPVQPYLSQVVRLDKVPSNIIRGTKTFVNAHIRNEVTCKTVNTVNLIELERNAFSKTKSQTVGGMWAFNNIHFQENLQVLGIGGVGFSDLVFLNDQQIEIQSPVKFTSKRTKIHGSLRTDGNLAGVKLEDDMLSLFNIDGTRKYDEVTVNGNVLWGENNPQTERLGYLFDNAVTHSGVNIIRGAVHFSQEFVSSQLEADNQQWLNDVDLQAIKDDALQLNNQNWILAGDSKFSKLLRLEYFGKAVNALDLNDVNGLSLSTLQQDVVISGQRKERVIHGTKAINGNINVKANTILGSISDTPIKDFVLKDDNRQINELHFQDVIVDKNLGLRTISGLDLQPALQNRVSLTQPQELLGSYELDQLGVKTCHASVINGISVRNMVKPSTEALTQFSGKKVLKNGIVIDGELNTPILNEHNTNQLFESTLRLDHKEVIKRAVVFEAPVIMNQEVVLHSVNEVNLHTFSDEVTSRLGHLVDSAETPEGLVDFFDTQTEVLKKIVQERPVWFDYLKLNKDWTNFGTKSRVDNIKRSKTGDILVTLHHESDGQLVGLPQGCSCNTVTTVKIDEANGGETKVVGIDQCLQVFFVQSHAGRTYTVTSETPSSNITCITSADKFTKIFTENALAAEIHMGHVSDVGVFTTSESDYLVLAEYFNKEIRSHSTTTRILRVETDGKIKVVQQIETHGARKVALSQVNDQWMLAIANSKNNIDESLCNADSAVYAWSQMDNEFQLLRTIMTDGVFDVEFITSTASNQLYDQSFIAFAQEGNSANGEVVIYKYDKAANNFALSQTIRSYWPLTALTSSCMCGQCFLVTVVPQQGITFYENRFVEGFQEYYNAPVFGATDVSSFTMNNQQLFAIASNDGPILAEAVLAGFC